MAPMYTSTWVAATNSAAEQDVLRGDRRQHGHQVQRGVHDVVGGDDAEAAVHDHGGDAVEEDVLGDHQRGTLRTLASEPAS